MKNIKNKILLATSFIIFIIAILINKANSIRPILAIITSIIIAFTIYTNTKVRKAIIPSFIISLLITIVIDSSVVLLFGRIPIYSYNIISTSQTRVYNGIGVIAWQCNKDDYQNIIVNPFYNKTYMCDSTNIDIIDSNSFLNSVVANYNDYKDKYVKIRGKISKKSSQSYIEMQPYNETDIVANGYVNFADNITLKILFNTPEETLDLYDIYDEIVVLGVIKNLDNKDGKYVIYMNDSQVVGDIDAEITSIDTIPSKSCKNTDKIIMQSDEYNIQTYCTEEIYITYNNTKYELTNAFSANKIDIEDFIDGIEGEETTKGIIYKAENYSVLKCNDSNTYIISNKNENFKKAICDLKE